MIAESEFYAKCGILQMELAVIVNVMIFIALEKLPFSFGFEYIGNEFSIFSQ